jgi:hypothetical protein
MKQGDLSLEMKLEKFLTYFTKGEDEAVKAARGET